jgi:hypothetical protein
MRWRHICKSTYVHPSANKDVLSLIELWNSSKIHKMTNYLNEGKNDREETITPVIGEQVWSARFPVPLCCYCDFSPCRLKRAGNLIAAYPGKGIARTARRLSPLIYPVKCSGR